MPLALNDSLAAAPAALRVRAALVDALAALPVGLFVLTGTLRGVSTCYVLAGIALVLVVGYQAFLLATEGRTLGQRHLNLAVVDADSGEPRRFARNLRGRAAVVREA